MDAVIGSIIAILVSLMGYSGFAHWAQIGAENIQNAATASQMLIYDKAGQQYIQDNAATIALSATPTSPVTITTAMLIAAKYLPTGFNGSNPFQQTYLLQVLQPSAGQLQGLVTTQGGSQIGSNRDYKQLVLIAAQMGAQGGFVPYANQAASGMTAANAYGSYGSWTVPLTGYTAPGSGHLATLLSFSGSAANNNFLYRVAVPGQPQLNAMQTDLSMTDQGGTAHNISGANTVAGQQFTVNNLGQFNSDQGGSLELGGNNSTAGTGTPYIDFHLGGQGVQDFNARMVNDTDGHISVQAANGSAAMSVQGYVQPGAIATPGVGCAKPGAIGANTDGTGMLLSCQRGTWRPIGGNELFMGYQTVFNGNWVAYPTCSAGSLPIIEIIPSNFVINTSATVNYVASINGAGWSVAITDGAGAGLPTTEGIAETFCAY